VSKWYSRPVLFVSDLDRAAQFYVEQLGFSESWRHVDDGQAMVAQVERGGSEFILSSQWPDKAGSGLIFVSLDPDVLHAARIEFEGRGVEVKDGWWGYKVMIVADADGNQLYFPYPADKEA
jgi:catechol 2,3-dioxygenase-like lactoylglutathione lyase family enzyme